MTTSHESLVRAALNLDKRKRREKRIDSITSLLTNVTLTFIGAWELMIAVGVARGEWLPNLPTIGYWPSVVLVALLRGTFAAYSAKGNDR